MTAPPLTHHDIVALVEPFARRGRHVDLAASRRDERRLVFRPAAAAAPATDDAAETLELQVLEHGSLRLTRTLARPGGATAQLQATGRDAAALLAAFDGVPAARHFVDGPGYVIARSYVVDPAAGGTTPEPTLVRGRIHVDGLEMTLDVPGVRRVAGEISLAPAPGQHLALPEDLLAVLGWNWARLVPVRQGWMSRVRLRGSPAERTRQAEAALDRAAAHLAATLAEPPARYHERHAAARLGVFFRRGIPTFTALGLFGSVGLVSRFFGDVSMAVWVAMYHVPTVIVAVAFLMQELPRFEIPPWPRPLRAPDWRVAPAN